MSRWSRSWRLVQASLAVLRADRELLLFPLMSGICSLVVVASFALPIIASGALHGLGHTRGQWLDGAGYLALFLFYLVQYAVIFFFNTALISAAMVRLEGGNPSLGDGLRAALSKLPQILGYAAIAATVGMLLRALENRLGFIGRLVVGLLGAAWSVATFLVVPVLAATDQGPVDAVRHSVELLRRTWGENLIGRLGFGLVFGLATFVLIALAVFGLTLAGAAHASVLVGVVIALAVLGFVLLMLLQSALQGIFAAALYRYAEYGEVDNGFDAGVLENAFNRRG